MSDARVRVCNGDLDDEAWEHVMTLVDVAIRAAMDFYPSTRGSGYTVSYKRTPLSRTRSGWAFTYAFHVLNADEEVVVSGTARVRLRG